MEKEPKKFDHEKRSKGDIEMERGDLSKAYHCYVQDNHIAGLYKVAKLLEEKGKKKDAAEVLAKAHQLCNVENGDS